MRHVVWDWNGTLFDDRHLVIEGLNVVLDDAGLPRIDEATYQRLYTRPVKTFYERLFGRPISGDEWAHVDEAYHLGYAAALDRAALAADALSALDVVDRTDRTQSLLSMWRHRELLALTEQLGIATYFSRIDGLRGPGDGRKAPHLEAHLERSIHLVGDDPSNVLLIGDALDDAAAAAHVGAGCVLFDGGSHPRAELERSGYPVAGSLLEALELAGIG